MLFRSQYEAFVTRLSSSGSAIIYSTYLGGPVNEYGYGVAVDDDSTAYVTGSTNSPNFPTVNPYQASLYRPNIIDAFVTRFSSDGSSLIYSTYLGGYSNDAGKAIALDSALTAYITGYTESTDFPIESFCQSSLGGGEDAFATRLSSDGSVLLYSTYLGGSGEDDGYGIAVGESGQASIVGHTLSNNFPMEDPYQSSRAGLDDAFVFRLSASGSELIYSSYLGGNDVDYGFGIAVDPNDDIYVTGYTESYDFPTENPYQASYAGGSRDAFRSEEHTSELQSH